MFKGFLARKAEKECAYKLYQALVQQARSEAFYSSCGVNDTLEGRFDMILLHVWLTDNRLESAGASFTRVRRYIQETLVSDMDRSLRELGVGDMSVGKEMKKVGAALLGRKKAYSTALEKGEDALKDVVKRNIYRGEDAKGVEMIADYITRTIELLAGQAVTTPDSSHLSFPEVLVRQDKK